MRSEDGQKKPLEKHKSSFKSCYVKPFNLHPCEQIHKTSSKTGTQMASPNSAERLSFHQSVSESMIRNPTGESCMKQGTFAKYFLTMEQNKPKKQKNKRINKRILQSTSTNFCMHRESKQFE
jgi:hypothetical protein